MTYAGDAQLPAIDGFRIINIGSPPRGRSFGSLFSPLSRDAFRLKSREFMEAVQKTVCQTDAIFVDYYAMGWITQVLGRVKPKKLVYISHNFEHSVRLNVASSVSNPFLRFIYTIDARKAAALEHRLCCDVDFISSITDLDRAAFSAAYPKTPAIHVPPSYSGTVKERRITDETPKSVVILGTFDWIAKYSSLERFITEASPIFQANSIRLNVVGSISPRLSDSLSARHPFVNFTGPVDSFEPYLSEARIGVIPDLSGGGLKLKALDYAFHGLPIAGVSSQLAGLPVTADTALIADNHVDLVHAIQRAIADTARLDRMQLAAKAAFAAMFGDETDFPLNPDKVLGSSSSQSPW